MLKKLSLCIFLINAFLTKQALGWIKVYEKNGVIYIVGRGEREFKKPKNAKEIIGKVEYYAKKYQIPVKLFKELVRAESNFNPKAVSPKGAMGLCQLMPQTAKRLKVKDPFDPDQNLNAGAKYLKELYLKYRNWKLALAAYNAGEGAVDRYGKVPPYKETMEYVRKILRRSSLREKTAKRHKNYKIVIYRKGNTIVISSVYR